MASGSESRAIPAAAFFEQLERSNERLLNGVVSAIQGIQIGGPQVNVAPPQVNVAGPQVNVPPVNVDVQGIIQSIENLSNRMVSPLAIRTIIQQINQLQGIDDAGNRAILASLEQLRNRVATPDDINNVIDTIIAATNRLGGALGNINLTVQGVLQSIQTLTNRTVTPAMIKYISDQLNQIGNLSDAANRAILVSLQQLTNQVASSADIQNVVNRVIEVTGALTNIEETLEEGFETIESGLVDIKNTNQLSYYLQDPDFFEYVIDPVTLDLKRVLKSRDGIINVLTQRGIIAFDNAVNRQKYLNMTAEELAKLGAVQSQIRDQSQNIYNYQNGIDYFSDKGYRRVGFDMLVKDGEKTKTGVPLNKEIKFRYSNIEPITIKRNNGMYEAHQGSQVFKAKNYRDVERFALRGGYQADELALLRKVEKSYYKKEEPLQVIFKARKW